MSLDADYWNGRYLGNDSPWDAGRITTPLKAYIDQLTVRDPKMLIPGAGNAHEATYLHELGFTNVHVLDFAEEPLEQFRKTHPSFPEAHLHREDFFRHSDAYDLIIEQTFFCALDPSLRAAYAKQMHALLKPGGKLVGVLFDTNCDGHPPFGGTAEEYRTYFEPYFDLKVFEACYNSVKPRAGRELFIKLVKRG